ncbi:MAG: type II toxin-antitoxin system RelE/ParE family toxin [Thaumarchaeota archaeon]|nr:type II toxin-antitoxin system RelE/ParE family toxin [Nitrososphaerota archaeon]
MVHKIVYKSSVSRDLKHIDPKRAARLLSEIKEILDKNPDAGEPLSGEFKGLYKLRIGEYRVIYTKIDGTLLVLRIRHRSKAYE